jgi:hypothetical protein
MAVSKAKGATAYQIQGRKKAQDRPALLKGSATA